MTRIDLSDLEFGASSADARVDATTEFHRRIALSKRQAEGPQAVGYCLECGEPLAAGLRWCDADCRDDWEKRNA